MRNRVMMTALMAVLVLTSCGATPTDPDTTGTTAEPESTTKEPTTHEPTTEERTRDVPLQDLVDESPGLLPARADQDADTRTALEAIYLERTRAMYGELADVVGRDDDILGYAWALCDLIDLGNLSGHTISGLVHTVAHEEYGAVTGPIAISPNEPDITRLVVRTVCPEHHGFDLELEDWA